MSNIPQISIPEVGTIEELRRHVEGKLNTLILQLNRGDFIEDVSFKDLPIPSDNRDAVTVEYLDKKINELRDKSLRRERRVAWRPGPFMKFEAAHYLARPDLPNSAAEPHIKLKVQLPAQANGGAGLQNLNILKRNTAYAIFTSPWDTLASALSSSTTTMTMNNASYFKAGGLYKIDDEWVRATSTSGSTVTIMRGQELTVASTHISGATVSWGAIVPRDGFTPDEDGALGASPDINNSERVAVRTFTGIPYNADGIAGSTSTAIASIAAAPTISDFAADPRYGEVILTWSEQTGSTYKYQVYKRIGSAPSFTSTYLYEELEPTFVGSYVYTDVLPRPGDANAITGTYGNNFYYGVKSINILGSGGTDDVGPLSGDASASNAAPDVTGVSAAEGPHLNEDGGAESEVTCSWTPPADATWNGVNIYLFRSTWTTQAPVKVATFHSSPGIFYYPTVGLVTLYFVSFNDDGVENAVLSSPSTTVTLDGQTSAPVAVSNLAAQNVVDGIMLSWSENAESDLLGYEVADCGDVTPINQGAIDNPQVIANVAGIPQGTKKVTYTFKETLFTGSSDGTTITITNAIWPTNAHVVNGTGKNVHFTLTNQNVQCVSNTANTITFSAASIPTGTVDFYIRGSDGAHKFYVRAVNKSTFKGDWRPAPPSILTVSPFAPDGSSDQGVPTVKVGPFGVVGRSYFTPSGASGGDGMIRVAASAESINTTKQNIEGITGWKVVVESNPNDNPATTNTTTFNFGADTSDGNFSFSGITNRWYLANYISAIPHPNANLWKLSLAAVNYFGTSALETTYDFAGTDTSANRPIGFIATDMFETSAASSSVTPNLAKAESFHATANAAFTVNNPINAISGRFVEILVFQDATGGRTITFGSNYKGVTNMEIDMTANTYSAFLFHTTDGTNFYLISPPITGAS